MAKAPTKTQVLNGLAERSGLSKKEVAAVLEGLSAYIGETISDGETPFTIPGLCKVVPQIKPATPARYGVANPFRPGETMDVAAKPERQVVKVRPLKGLKDMVAGGAPAAAAPPADDGGGDDGGGDDGGGDTGGGDTGGGDTGGGDAGGGDAGGGDAGGGDDSGGGDSGGGDSASSW
jgi:nucleoid DNA-binding protein